MGASAGGQQCHAEGADQGQIREAHGMMYTGLDET